MLFFFFSRSFFDYFKCSIDGENEANSPILRRKRANLYSWGASTLTSPINQSGIKANLITEISQKRYNNLWVLYTKDHLGNYIWNRSNSASLPFATN
jgi:hypothetical protein